MSEVDRPPLGPATLGSTARAHLMLRVWCKDCQHRATVDQANQVERYAARLTCSQCGSRQVDFVVTPRSADGVED